MPRIHYKSHINMKSITTLCYLATAATLFTCPVLGADKGKLKVWTDPAEAKQEDPDFSIQGEYGSAAEGVGVGVQVVALGDGKFDAYVLEGGLPGAGWTREKNRTVMKGGQQGDEVVFSLSEPKMSAKIQHGKLILSDADGNTLNPQPTKDTFTPGTLHIHNLNATILHLLGIDHKRLTYRYQGRDFRLTDVHGHVVHDLIA